MTSGVSAVAGPAAGGVALRGVVFGHRVVCVEPLERLGRHDEPAPFGTVTVEMAEHDVIGTATRPPGADAVPGTPVHERRADGTIRVSVPGAATFDLAAARRLITVRGTADRHWRHRLVNSAIPLLLTARRHLVLHAAAVVLEDRAVLFVGPSRRGKSSLAAAAADLGLPVLAEDGVLVTAGGDGAGAGPCSPPVVAWPGAADVRLFDRRVLPGDTDVPAKRTRFLSGSETCRRPTPVAQVVVLGPRGGRVAPEPLDPRRRVAALLANAFSVDEETRTRQFDAVVTLARVLPVHRVHLPDDLARLTPTLRALVGRLRETVLIG